MPVIIVGDKVGYRSHRLSDGSYPPESVGVVTAVQPAGEECPYDAVEVRFGDEAGADDYYAHQLELLDM